ncbi:hypothetical protein GJ631_06265 [Natronomonas sp. CBA1123]|uniref:DUF7263 family protein n=1 Tax=Natronomonas sp. CBA1123 TaxID=2668070 RepID=UPI0012E9AAFA|nr:hypothetical protein [Natronomonas sp. CBA1123]MUV86188.1 hypothetical protein [Natronomonas sp. CBA1123]
MRGQANLPALALALLVVTTVAGLSVTIADSAFSTAQRDASERATASAVADRLVAADSPLPERRNVLNASRLDESTVSATVPDSVDARITVAGKIVYERGDPSGGPTVRRLTVVAERQPVTIEPPLAFGTVTLPRRSPRATISIDSDSDVETVRANDRVVLYDAEGINGTYDVSLSRYETTTLQFDGSPREGDVTVTYYPRQTTKAILEVTVE